MTLPRKAYGLNYEEEQILKDLVNTFERHRGKNAVKERYYEGNIPLSEVNLGIALPQGLSGLEIGCSWGAKTVDVLAARSMFDGFVGEDSESVDIINKVVKDNNLVTEYKKSCKDELKIGCAFATLSRDDNIGCRIRFHSAQTAVARWNGALGRIDCGLVIVDTVEDETKKGEWNPSLINLHTDNAVWVLKKRNHRWYAKEHKHKMGRPLMQPLIWDATSGKPFGQSRLKNYIRRLIQGYVRTIANATIGLEFSTAPQKYLMGVTDDQFDAVINDKFRQYVGNIIAATRNPETGENPVFGQLQQGSISPHVEMVRVLSTQFSAATGLTVTDTGVVNDANPTSSEAILAQSQTLIRTAEELNSGNGDALRIIALMALAIIRDKSMDELSDTEKDIVAHFKNPAMPSVAATSDAAMKIASARPGFSDTDVFLEMIGFDQADIRRIKAQEQRIRGAQLLEGFEFESDEEGESE